MLLATTEIEQGALRDAIAGGASFVRENDTEYGSSPQGATPPRLGDRARAAMRLRHFSRRTESAYLHWMRRYFEFHGRRDPKELGAEHVTAFLSHLAEARHVAASTQNQALAALIFLYREVLSIDLPWLDGLVRANRPQHLPVVLTRDEVKRVLAEMTGVPRQMAMLLYGSGLRLLECCQLRVKDVDFARNQILVRQGKGAKDRATMLPATAKVALVTQLDFARKQHQRDLAAGAGWVELPFALARKYPNAGREWAWQWVFPATRGYIEPETGERRRHHLRDFVKRCGIEKGGVPSWMATKHILGVSPERKHRDGQADHERP